MNAPSSSSRHERLLSTASAMRQAGHTTRNPVLRAAIAAAVAQTYPGADQERALARLFPEDQHAAIMLRGAVMPASLSSADWAGALASTAVADFVAGLGPASAASQILAAGLQINLGRSAGVTIPSAPASAAGMGFYSEGAPIAVSAFGIGGPALKPFKIAGIAVLTSETAKSTAAESIIAALLVESSGLALDAALFGTDAAVEGERPAGLLNGAATITPATGGGADAMTKDLGALAAAAAPIAGSRITFVASPGEAAKLLLRASPAFPFPLHASGALPAGTVVAIATNALASAVDPVPEIDVSREAVLHMDTSPTQISTEAGAAAPVQSMFQGDCVALRLLFGVSWVLRAPASQAVAVIRGVTW